jgi:hypothetical protein
MSSESRAQNPNPENNGMPRMKITKFFKRVISKTPLVVVLAAVFYIIILAVSRAVLTPLSIAIAVAVIIMLTGQLSTVTSYSLAYFLYYASYFVSTIVALYIWMSSRFPFFDIYLLSLLVIFATVFVAHFKTRKRPGVFPLFPVISISIFGLLIALSSGSITGQTADWLFGISFLLFTFVTIQCLNSTYRTRILNKKLHIVSVEDYCSDRENKLIERFNAAIPDVDLLLYYLRSALNRFVNGDLEGSYMDAFKIVFDEQGQAFKQIFILSDVNKKAKPYSETRAILTHAKGRGAALKKIKEEKFELFDKTLDLLEIVKEEFIEESLRKPTKPA